ncbi:serine protease snake-like [Tribolium madens]|uniref:serine protease snake-like n=1 Tax=Tribolium madens TaxID=41895 RepID=UPI001CF73B21|nr:serine protease snake-like [Tribolium madens]
MNWLIFVFPVFGICVAFNFEGDTCFTNVVNKTLLRGQCIDINNCDFAKELLRQGKRPQNCGVSGNSIIVCCPTSQKIIQRLKKTKSEEKCEEYNDKRNLSPGIVGGVEAKPKEFPHMTAIGFGSAKNIEWLCGGSLISEKFVLTAAHCITSQNGVPKWVRVGDLNLKNTTDDAKPQEIKIEESFKHPNYNSRFHYHDIALLKLKSPVKFGLYSKPACLHTKTRVFSEQLQAIGWGKTDFFGDTSSDLLKVFLKEVKFGKCARIYSPNSSRKLPRGLVDEIQICAGGIGKDTCQGDSGGPLHFLKKGSGFLTDHFVIVGITSFGKACGMENSAGVYTRVSTYRSWIESIVWPE